MLPMNSSVLETSTQLSTELLGDLAERTLLLLNIPWVFLVQGRSATSGLSTSISSLALSYSQP